MLHITCAHGVVAGWRGPVRVGSGGGQGLVARRSAAPGRHSTRMRSGGMGARPRHVRRRRGCPPNHRHRARCRSRSAASVPCELRPPRAHTMADDALRCARSWSMEGSRPWPRNVAGGIRVLCLRPRLPKGFPAAHGRQLAIRKSTALAEKDLFSPGYATVPTCFCVRYSQALRSNNGRWYLNVRAQPPYSLVSKRMTCEPGRRYVDCGSTFQRESPWRELRKKGRWQCICI